MAFIVNNNGDIDLVQGDSGEILISGIPTDRNYKVFFSIYNSVGEIIGNEVNVYSNKSDEVILNIPSSLTDLLNVTGGIDSTEEYYYGIKLCDEENNTEDTQYINGGQIGDLNRITVYPKKVEGITQ